MTRPPAPIWTRSGSSAEVDLAHTRSPGACWIPEASPTVPPPSVGSAASVVPPLLHTDPHALATLIITSRIVHFIRAQSHTYVRLRESRVDRMCLRAQRMVASN